MPPTGGAAGAVSGSGGASGPEMESHEEFWADWLRQDNEYAIGDRKAMEAGGI